MSCTQSSARRRRESRIDFCAAIMIYQQQHEDLSASRAFEAVKSEMGCPFDGASDPFHAFELFHWRNREQVRTRVHDFCKKRQEMTGATCIDREALERMPGVSVVDLEIIEKADLSEEERRFVDDTVKALLSQRKEAEKIIRDHVIKTYL